MLYELYELYVLSKSKHSELSLIALMIRYLLSNSSLIALWARKMKIECSYTLCAGQTDGHKLSIVMNFPEILQFSFIQMHSIYKLQTCFHVTGLWLCKLWFWSDLRPDNSPGPGLVIPGESGLGCEQNKQTRWWLLIDTRTTQYPVRDYINLWESSVFYRPLHSWPIVLLNALMKS